MMKFLGWGDPNKHFDLSHRPFLWNFIRAQTGLCDVPCPPPIRPEQLPVPAPKLTPGFLEALGLAPAQISTDPQVRLHHTYGKSYRDLLRARAGVLDRVPDVVLFPERREDVEAIFRAASACQVQIVPFGGGTNIVGGVEVDSSRTGMAATVSLRRMNRVLAIDPVACTARIEAGALGPDLEKALNAEGFSLGHFPDSFEFSTLGGWLATRSAGMQSDAYGKIEGMVISLTLVTPAGTVVTRNVPRSATGPDLNQIIVGSEGTLGIITEAVMRIHRVAAREYRGVLVPGFANGIALSRAIAQSGVIPSTTRIANPQETALGFALKSAAKGWPALVSKAFKFYLRKVKRFPMDQACLMILGFEGADSAAIASQSRKVLALARKFGAVDLGTKVGAHWFAGKYDYPYLRDVVMDRGGMVDVNETAATWDLLPGLYERVDSRLHAHLAKGEYPGYVGCHLSHSYPEGACLYFTFAAAAETGNELRQYLEVKRLIAELLLAEGATLTHHHAVGYELLPWMAAYLGDTGVQMLRGLKHSVDPLNLCNPGKLIPGDPLSMANYWPKDLLGPPEQRQ